jgi:hypothetical protein
MCDEGIVNAVSEDFFERVLKELEDYETGVSSMFCLIMNRSIKLLNSVAESEQNQTKLSDRQDVNRNRYSGCKLNI